MAGLLASAPSAGGAEPPAPVAFAPDREVVLVCAVTGAGKIRPAATAPQICAEFKRRFDTALGRGTRSAASPPARGQLVTVDLRITATGAAALVAARAGGKTHRWPEIAVDVMDKQLGMREIGLLAGNVARVVSHKP